MAKMSEILSNKKKKKNYDSNKSSYETYESEWTKQTLDKYNKGENIAPFFNTKPATTNTTTNTTSAKKNNSLFSDGYDFGDIANTILNGLFGKKETKVDNIAPIKSSTAGTINNEGYKSLGRQVGDYTTSNYATIGKYEVFSKDGKYYYYDTSQNKYVDFTGKEQRLTSSETLKKEAEQAKKDGRTYNSKLSVADQLKLDDSDLTEEEYDSYSKDLQRQQKDKEEDYARKYKTQYGGAGLKGSLGETKRLLGNLGKNIDDEVVEPIRDIKDNYNYGKKTEQLMKEAYKKMTGKKNNYDSLKKEVETYSKFNQDIVENGNYLDQSLQSLPNQVGGFIAGTEGGGIGSLAGLILGGTVGKFTGLGIGKGAALGAKYLGGAGYVTGQSQYTYELETGGQYMALLDLGVPEDIAKKEAKKVGVINAAIESGESILDLISLGQLGKVKTALVKNLVKEYGEDTVEKWVGTTVLRNTLSEGAEEGLQETSSILSERRATKEAGIEREATLKEDLERVKESFIVGALGGFLSSGATTVISGGAKTIANTIKNNKGQTINQAVTEQINNYEKENGPLDKETKNQLIKETEQEVINQVQNASNTEVNKEIAPIKETQTQEQSEPKTYYHGTRGEFDTFDNNKIGQNYDNDWSSLGKGFYFSNDYESAKKFGESSINDGKVNVKEATLDIKQPLYIDDLSKNNQQTISDIATKYELGDIANGYNLIDGLKRNGYDSTDVLKQYGYDGIIAEDEVMVFDSNQIHNKKANTVKNVQENNNKTENIVENKDLKSKQLEIIQKNNPMEDDYHTGIRSVDDIKTAQEVFTTENFEEVANPDFTYEMSQEALKNGKVKVYSSYPIEQGTFVSTSKMEAESYSSNGKVYEKTVDLNDIAWIENTQGQYAKVETENKSESITPVKEKSESIQQTKENVQENKTATNKNGLKISVGDTIKTFNNSIYEVTDLFTTDDGVTRAKLKSDNYETSIGINAIEENLSQNKMSVKEDIAPVKEEKVQTLEQRVSGDDLLDAQDLIEEVKSVGANVDENGYVTVYHQTSAENAAKIKQSGKMTANEDYVYFSTSKNASQSESRGQAKLEFKIPAEKLLLDDIFSDNADVKVPLKGSKVLDVADYLVNQDLKETSIENDIAPIKQELADLTSELKDTIKETKEELKTLTKEINEVKSSVEDIAPVENKIQGLENYSREEIKNIAKDYIKEKLEENNLYDVEIKDAEIIGSRNRGNARTNSDLDVVVEYKGDIREDTLFDILNEDPMFIDDVQVDINPITESDTGTLEDYIKRSNEYDKEVLAKQDTKSLAEQQADTNLQSITDNDIAPVKEDTTPDYSHDTPMSPDSPLENRDIDEVGNRKAKAYQYENPEVRPYFRAEAVIMLNEIENTVKGARIPIYDEVGNMDYVGVTRETTDAIAYLKDNYNYSYAEIEKGLNAIIEDNGKENIAVAKRIEFMLDDRLRNGYTAIDGTQIPANQEYIDFLNEKGITEYNQEVSKGLNDEFAPVENVENPMEKPIENASNTQQIEDIAPIVETKQDVTPVIEETKEQTKTESTLKEYMEYEDPVMKAVKNQVKRELEKTIGERRNELFANDEYNNNNVNPKPKKSFKEKITRTWDAFQSHMVNRNRQIDKLSKSSGNAEIKFKGDRVNNISGEVAGDIFTAQTDNYGNVIGKSLDAPFAEARKEGVDTYFDNYLKHQSNIERHAQGKGSSVVSAETSKKYVKAYESKFPQFKGWAKDVYTYNQNLLNNSVNNGLIDTHFKNLLTSMYGKYVPFYEVNNDLAPSVNESIDEIKAYRPIKRAKGGSDSNLLGVEQAMIRQTYAYKNAIAKNDLYKEIGKASGKKVELGADVRTSPTSLDSTLYADENGKYLNYYENGQQKTVQISDDLYTELSRDLEKQIRNLEEKYSLITKPLQKISQVRGQILTTYNVGFVVTNPFKDIQDALFNTKYFGKYLKNVLTQSTLTDSVRGKNINRFAEQFKTLTGKDITSVKDASSLKGKAKAIYKDYQAGAMWNRFITSYGSNAASMEFNDTGVDVKAKNKGFLNGIERANNYMEVMFRYPEFKSTLEKGGSFTEALYNAREVTTNFGRGGTISKAINRNGATFFNTSVQGMDKFFRNFSGENGARGFVGAVAKAVTVGMLPAVFNDLLFGSGDDKDEDYEAIPNYIKDNYYLFKTSEGEFIRIPKGRMIAVLGSAARRTLELAGGDKDAFKGFLKNASDQIGASNPLKENILSPLIQAYGSENGEAWYGGDLVPTRLQNKPKAEQFDEGTDEFSKWLGKQLNISPYKLNYVIDQYTGGFGDIVLPMITEEAKSDGTLLAPLKDKFTANSTDDNKYVEELYDKGEELTKNANSSVATDEDVLKNKYLNNIKSQMGELYGAKREIQSDTSLTKEEKYNQIKIIQDVINKLAKYGLDSYNNVEVNSNYAKVGELDYYKTSEGEWYSVKDEEAEALNSMGMTSSEKNSYFKAKTSIYDIKNRYGDMLDNASEDEKSDIYTSQKREIIDEILNTNLNDEEKAYLYDKYYASTDKLNVILNTNIPMDVYLSLEYQNFTADKDKYGKSINGSKKAKIVNYIENSGLDYGQKILLHKTYYPADDSYNYEIADYVFNNVEAYEDIINILETLGYTIGEDGTVYWD